MRCAVQDGPSKTDVNGWALGTELFIKLPGKNVDQHGTSTFQRVGAVKHWFLSSDCLLSKQWLFAIYIIICIYNIYYIYIFEEYFSTFFNGRTSKSKGWWIGIFENNSTKIDRQKKAFRVGHAERMAYFSHLFGCFSIGAFWSKRVDDPIWTHLCCK